MRIRREEAEFPTRNYPYSLHLRSAAMQPSLLQPNVIHRRIVGIDQGSPRPMTESELALLDDPMGRLLRSGKAFPLSARQLIRTLDELTGADALPRQLVFLAADGGHIPWSPQTDDLQRAFRFAITRGDQEFTVMVSCSTSLDSEATGAFLQVLGWDEAHGVFHYYERRDGTFIWAGNSEHALSEPSRGRGPFDSHVNGSLVMKELRSPWIHWHAPLAGINATALAPDDPLQHDPIFTSRVTAERLESEVVRPAIRKWNAARVSRAISNDGVWRRIDHYIRQVATATTVNLASSETASAALSDGDTIRPPLTFFLDRDTLFDQLELVPEGLDISRIAIPGQLYLDCLQRYDVHRFDGKNRIEGDVQFAFLVPEPAFEDTQLVDQLLQSGLLTRRMAVTIAMTDFTNPVFSARRAALAKYAPPEISGPGPGDPGAYGDLLESQLIGALRASVAKSGTSASAPDSPEREALFLYDSPDLEGFATRRIEAYLAAVKAGASDASVVDGWFRLAEHRRRAFRRFPLAEFKLTTPATNIATTAPPMRMTEAGRAVEVAPSPALALSPFSAQAPSDQADGEHAVHLSPPALSRTQLPQELQMPMTRFDPPGFLDDLDEAGKEEWSRRVAGWIDRARYGKPAQNDGPRDQFFNPLTSSPASDAVVAAISWGAFPRQVRLNSANDQQRWRTADGSRDVQDEYCEWSVEREPVSGKILRVNFTCEGPEYWHFLAATAPDKLLQLYRQLASPQVQAADLFRNGGYDPLNKFNRSTSGGLVHLVQQANTLGAEIELAAAATIRRMRNGTELTDAQSLISCSRYGEPSRNSDPHIGEQVNALARQRADITLNNPIGLYFDSFNPVGWVTPDGADPRSFWRFTRGSDGHWVRAVYEVTPDKPYVVGDIKIAGRPIKFGAQIADFITMKLEGLATRIGLSTVAPVNGCRGTSAAPPSIAARATAESAAVATRAPSEDFSAGAAPASIMVAPAIMTERDEALMAELSEVAAAPPTLRPYPRLPDSHFAARAVTGRIMAYASPDSTYAVTSRLIDSASNSLVVGIYDFSASYMLEALKRAMQRGVSVTVMLDTNSGEERDLLEELAALGADCEAAPSSSSGSPNAYFGNAHEKIIVVDGEIVMIQSGNWSENSIPFNPGDGQVVGQFQAGNRDMGLAIQSRELAELFAGLVLRDIRLARGEPPDLATQGLGAAAAGAGVAADRFFEAAPASIPTRLFTSLTVVPDAPVEVMPVVTPENYHPVVRELLRSAKRSIRVEQQYIRGRQAAVLELIEEIDRARQLNPGLDVRIIVSPKYLRPAERQSYEAALESIGLEFDENFRYLSLKHFVHCHNKLIVVDEERVLVGSQNWSTTGVLTNREASLLVSHAGISSYFAGIFDADWQMSRPSSAAPADLPSDFVRPMSDFAGGGIVVSSKADYRDV